MKTVFKGHFKEADHLGNLDDVGGEKIKAPGLNAKRGFIVGNEGFFIKGLDPTRTVSAYFTATLKYLEPLGYLISLIFHLPLLGGDG